MEDKNSNGNENSDIAEEYANEDVVIKDFLPALKAVCDKLEQADGKVNYVIVVCFNYIYIVLSGLLSWLFTPLLHRFLLFRT